MGDPFSVQDLDIFVSGPDSSFGEKKKHGKFVLKITHRDPSSVSEVLMALKASPIAKTLQMSQISLTSHS